MLVGPDRARAASRRGPPPGPSAVTRGDPVGVDEDVADELDLGSARPALNCHTFQLAVLDAAGLVDGTGNYHTRGGGCPVLAPGRRWAGRLTGRRRWPGNLPRPGRRLADLDPSLWPPASTELASTGP